jgi:hypothetical protein
MSLARAHSVGAPLHYPRTDHPPTRVRSSARRRAHRTRRMWIPAGSSQRDRHAASHTPIRAPRGAAARSHRSAAIADARRRARRRRAAVRGAAAAAAAAAAPPPRAAAAARHKL